MRKKRNKKKKISKRRKILGNRCWQLTSNLKKMKGLDMIKGRKVTKLRVIRIQRKRRESSIIG